MNTKEQLQEERIKQLEMELLNANNTINQCKKEQEDFIMIASHDLQAPLRKLSTFVERLTYKFKDVSGDEARSYIERIQSTLTDMRTIIDNLSALADCEGSKAVFKKCDLNEILQNILKDMQPVIRENNAVVTFSALPAIEGNYIQLKDLFRSFLNNSVKFKKKGSSLQINIVARQINEEDEKTFNLSKNKVYHKIEIMDNGIGFGNQYSKKIFQPFVRLHGKSAYKGNGFGLALCKKIIENHHGFIFSKSGEDSGTSFTLILPETYY